MNPSGRVGLAARNRAHFVIAISSISGGGKATFVHRLVELLEDAIAIHFDDYETGGVGIRSISLTGTTSMLSCGITAAASVFWWIRNSHDTGVLCAQATLEHRHL